MGVHGKRPHECALAYARCRNFVQAGAAASHVHGTQIDPGNAGLVIRGHCIGDHACMGRRRRRKEATRGCA